MIRAMLMTTAVLLLRAQAAALPQPEVPAYQAPVLVRAIGFSARHQGGKVKASWRKYRRADFKFYKVVRSSTMRDPVFPENGAVFSSAKPYVTEFMDPRVDAGVWYYRLCIVTQGGNRWVSPVVEVVVSKEASAEGVPTARDFE